ncbi:hypothetical protein [Paenibacillus tarimensis]|uniref:hypothetical protein n=1 Tax=Paenibacillus tarimensis TaxID=416012 RepID=UPI001F304C02|nr:hypothetical protein [Paenibacillus tarimensis]MCF2942906.1 hypothetical protein [Paenibacillus tarimensis]
MLMIRMRRAALTGVVAAAVVLSGCSNNTTDQQADTEVVEPAENSNAAVNAELASEELLQEFDKTVGEADTALHVREFIDEHIEQAAGEDADIMVRGLLDYYKKNLPAAEASVSESSLQMALLQADWPFEGESLEQLEPPHRKLVQALLDGGYKLETQEGYIYPMVDYGSLRKYETYITDALSDYIELKALESDQRTASDAAIVISWDELAGRALAAEEFVRKHPDSPEYEEVLTLLERYMTVYLQGLDNTPIYDYQTLSLEEDVKSSYAKIAGEKPETTVGTIVKGYLDVLEAANYQVMTGSGVDQQILPGVREYLDSLKRRIWDHLPS